MDAKGVIGSAWKQFSEEYHPVTDLERVIKSIVRSRKHREWDPIITHVERWISALRASFTKLQ